MQKSAEEQKDLLSPIFGNILKMTIRTLSTKRTKKNPELSLPGVCVIFINIFILFNLFRKMRI